jgi:nitroreductase
MPGDAPGVSALITKPSQSVEDALRSRRSVRAYTAQPVESAIIEKILEAASFAPSGSNIQPWTVHVLTGATLARVGQAMTNAFLSGEKGHVRDYNYYTDEMFEPYLARRRVCGFGLYGVLGIERHDKEGRRRQQAANYSFFGAPVGLVFTIDRRLEKGSYLDYGMFVQSIMLAARSHGLHTCPQSSIGDYPAIIRKELAIADDQLVLCGMALGYADAAAAANTFTPPREQVQSLAVFHR